MDSCLLPLNSSAAETISLMGHSSVWFTQLLLTLDPHNPKSWQRHHKNNPNFHRKVMRWQNVWHIQFLEISGQLLCICCCQQVSAFLFTHENKIEIFIWYHLNHPETSSFLSFVLLVAQNKLYVLCCKISKTYQWFLSILTLGD